MSQANQFLKSNEIPKDLQTRVRKYLEYKYEKESSQVDEKQALLVLSSSLRDEVLAEVNIRLIKSAQILTSKFNSDILVQLPFLLEEQIYGPEESIFLEGEEGREKENGNSMDDRCIYFVNKGQVLLCISKTSTQLKVLQKGDTFGELGFFSNRPRSASAYTLNFVYVQKLRKGDFLNILKSNQEQNQKYLMDKNTIELRRNHKPLGLKCYGCESKSHFAIDCPNLHFVTSSHDMKRLIQQYKEDELRKNKQFMRHEKVRYNARICIGLTQDVAKEINFVYKQVQEELAEDDEKLNQKQILTFYKSFISQKQEDKSIVQSDQLQMGSNLALFQNNFEDYYYDDYDRQKHFRVFFPKHNLEAILEQYNETATRNIQLQTQDTKVNNFNKSKTRTIKKKRWPRSSSAERASYFEKLIEKHGGAEQFLNKLHSQID